MTIPRSLVLAISLLIPALGAGANEQLPWGQVRELVSVVSAPPSVRDNPALARIGYDEPPSQIRGFHRDLNSDGNPELFVESARDLCGQAGCAYALFDGSSYRLLGEMSGNLLRQGSLRFNGWAVLEWSSHINAETAAYASFAYTGSEYAPVSFLQFPASRITFPER